MLIYQWPVPYPISIAYAAIEKSGLPRDSRGPGAERRARGAAGCAAIRPGGMGETTGSTTGKCSQETIQYS